MLGESETLFIDNVEEYMKTQESLEAVIERLQGEYQKLKFLESRLTEQKATMKRKIPEIQKSLDALTSLSSSLESAEQPIKTNFELSSNVLAEGEIDPSTRSVFLWLGANVMVEYPFNEAIELLSTNLANAKASYEKFDADLNYVKDQVTITEFVEDKGRLLRELADELEATGQTQNLDVENVSA